MEITTTEFARLVDRLNIAYKSRYILKEADEVSMYYNMLKDIDKNNLEDAVYKCIKHEAYFPSIATIRKYATNRQYPDWSIEWNRYVDKIPLYELSKPTQYVVKLLTQRYINGMVAEDHIGQIQKEFKQLYDKYCNEDMEAKLIESGDYERFIYINPNKQIAQEEEQTGPIMYNGWVDDEDEEDTEIDGQNGNYVIQ